MIYFILRLVTFFNFAKRFHLFSSVFMDSSKLDTTVENDFEN